jgi:hypothetical protein
MPIEFTTLKTYFSADYEIATAASRRRMLNKTSQQQQKTTKILPSLKLQYVTNSNKPSTARRDAASVKAQTRATSLQKSARVSSISTTQQSAVC